MGTHASSIDAQVTRRIAPRNQHIAADADPPPVWPSAEGPVRGSTFEPLHETVPAAAAKDASLHADPNRTLFESVVDLLRPLLDELVFVGGCTTGLLVTDSASSGIRPTQDVDATEGAPSCRWRYGDVLPDVLPIHEDVLGFSNRWHPSAIQAAQTFLIARSNIRVVTPVCFVATKLEAFHGRGAGAK
jgi:hypothetical protein